MPDLGKTIRDEISRIAGRELRSALSPLNEQISSLEREVSELRSQVAGTGRTAVKAARKSSGEAKPAPGKQARRDQDYSCIDQEAPQTAAPVAGPDGQAPRGQRHYDPELGTGQVETSRGQQGSSLRTAYRGTERGRSDPGRHELKRSAPADRNTLRLTFGASVRFLPGVVPAAPARSPHGLRFRMYLAGFFQTGIRSPFTHRVKPAPILEHEAGWRPGAPPGFVVSARPGSPLLFQNPAENRRSADGARRSRYSPPSAIRHSEATCLMRSPRHSTRLR